MSGKLQPVWTFEEARKNPHRGKTIQVRNMFAKLQSVWLFEEAPKNPQKTFKCEACLASFCWCGHLKEHFITHSGEKPFNCEVCLASFSNSGNLKRHLRTHSVDKPFKCNLSFAWQVSDGLEHWRSTEEPGWGCTIPEYITCMSGKLRALWIFKEPSKNPQWWNTIEVRRMSVNLQSV